MSTNGESPEPGHPVDEDDLDALIGGLQAEAARRRAEPAFPLDDEARLGVELDRQAPQPLPPKLERLARAASQAAASPDPDAGSGRRGRRGRRPAGSAGPVGPAGPEATAARPDLRTVVATALHTLSGRLADLDARLLRVEHPGRAEPTSPPPSGAATPSATLDDWRDRLPEHLPGPVGRVLYDGVDAEEAVGRLRHAAVDAYGLSAAADSYQANPDLQPGDLLQHLGAVADGGLAAAVLVEVPVTDRPDALPLLAAELGRVTPVVVVISEAPWWWRARVGPEQADLAGRRPVSAETWLAALHGAGFVASAEYAPAGGSYRVVGRRPS